MLTYNTQRKRLTLPEYGRNIQQMVDHCLTIQDRNERTACAHSIVAAMSNLFPSLRNTEGFRAKLWDHIAIMSDFKLDIDYPVEIVRPDSLTSVPDKLSYDTGCVRRRQYGKYVENMIETAASMPAGEEKDTLIMLLANHMKKLLIATDSEGIDDERIFKDLKEMSEGAIILDPTLHKLHEFQAAPKPQGKKKKKK